MSEKDERFVDLLATFYKKFFIGTAEAVDVLADIEKDYPEEYQMIKSFGDNPNSIEDLMEGLSSTKQSVLLKLLLKSGKFAKDFINLLNFNEQQKRNLSKELKDFASEMTAIRKENKEEKK